MKVKKCKECGWNHDNLEVVYSTHGPYFECPMTRKIVFLITMIGQDPKHFERR